MSAAVGLNGRWVLHILWLENVYVFGRENSSTKISIAVGNSNRQMKKRATSIPRPAFALRVRHYVAPCVDETLLSSGDTVGVFTCLRWGMGFDSAPRGGGTLFVLSLFCVVFKLVVLCCSAPCCGDWCTEWLKRALTCVSLLLWNVDVLLMLRWQRVAHGTKRRAGTPWRLEKCSATIFSRRALLL